MNYDVNHFIKKFEAIPEYNWAKGWGSIRGNMPTCATGHCGFDNSVYMNETRENTGLIKIFSNQTLHYLNEDHGDVISDNDLRFSWKVVRINDGVCKEYQQPTPKQRILAALYDIKKMQEVGQPVQDNVQHEYKDLTKELATLPINETSDVKIKVVIQTL